MCSGGGGTTRERILIVKENSYAMARRKDPRLIPPEQHPGLKPKPGESPEEARERRVRYLAAIREYGAARLETMTPEEREAWQKAEEQRRIPPQERPQLARVGNTPESAIRWFRRYQEAHFEYQLALLLEMTPDEQRAYFRERQIEQEVERRVKERTPDLQPRYQNRDGKLVIHGRLMVPAEMDRTEKAEREARAEVEAEVARREGRTLHDG